MCHPTHACHQQPPREADEVVVDEATRSVFLKWHSASTGIHGTDTYFFNGQFKIVRQHTTMGQRTGASS